MSPPPVTMPSAAGVIYGRPPYTPSSDAELPCILCCGWRQDYEDGTGAGYPIDVEGNRLPELYREPHEACIESTLGYLHDRHAPPHGDRP